MGAVLLVDDDRVQQLAIAKILRRSGLTVIVANDGVEALKLVQLYCPDLVILDIVLPKMNGYEVCRKLKQNKKTQNLPIVIYTAKSEKIDIYWGIKQGADAYISKPCPPQQLVNTVNQLLQKNKKEPVLSA